MRIVHFEFPKLGRGVSGGEVCLLETAKELAKMGHENVVLTTELGQAVYEDYGLDADYRCIPGFDDKHPFVSYVKRVRPAIQLIDGMDWYDDDLLVCNSDPFPNTIPFAHAADKTKRSRLLYWQRMRAPRLFYGYEGEATGRRQLPSLALMQMKAAQWLWRMLMSDRGVLITHNPYYHAELLLDFPKAHRVIDVPKYGQGLTCSLDRERYYDFAWLGRFHRGKGLKDFLIALKYLRLRGVKFKAVVMGSDGGSTKAMEDYAHSIGVDVEFAGDVNKLEKTIILARTKVFVQTSYHEAYGITLVEAMSAGCAIAAYELPVYRQFLRGAVTIPVGDIHLLSLQMERLFNDRDYCNALGRTGYKASLSHTWRGVAERMLDAV